MRSHIIENIQQDGGNNGYRRPDENIDRHTEFFRPVVAVKGNKQGRYQEKHRHFTDVQPAPIRRKRPAGAANGWSPGQFLNEIEKKNARQRQSQ